MSLQVICMSFIECS